MSFSEDTFTLKSDFHCAVTLSVSTSEKGSTENITQLYCVFIWLGIENI